MRITNGMMISNMINNLGRNTQRLNIYQNQLDTGKKIQIPSDDPIVAARALKLRTDVSKVEQYQKNISDAQSWLDETDVTLGKVGDLLQKARELTEQAANGTNTIEETQSIGMELKQLKAQLTHLSNATYAGRYIFSGYKTDQKLIYDENDPNYGVPVISVSNTQERIFYEIGVGDSLNINVTGGEVFNNGNSTEGGVSAKSTSNINALTYPYTFSVADNNNVIGMTINGHPVTATIPDGTTCNSEVELASTVQKAVNNVSGANDKVTVNIANDTLEIATVSKTSSSTVSITPASTFFTDIGASGTVTTAGAGQVPTMFQLFNDVIEYADSANHQELSNSLGQFDIQIQNVLRARADVGARQNRVDLSEDRMGVDLINFTDLMSKNEDVDIAETIMNLKNEENVYQASLAGGARIIQQTLVDFLR